MRLAAIALADGAMDWWHQRSRLGSCEMSLATSTAMTFCW